MTLPDFSSWLRRHRQADASLRLDRMTVQSVHEELHRLRQSNDRMRKQNVKLRRRITQLKESGIDDAADGLIAD